jgi:hypothetical protein
MVAWQVSRDVKSSALLRAMGFLLGNFYFWHKFKLWQNALWGNALALVLPLVISGRRIYCAVTIFPIFH